MLNMKKGKERKSRGGAEREIDRGAREGKTEVEKEGGRETRGERWGQGKRGREEWKGEGKR